MKRALISVYDKTGVAEFAKGLVMLEYGIISSGGTYSSLIGSGLTGITTVEQATGSPEMMDGLVKTLHPRIHGAILADRDNPSHLEQMKKHGIEPIDIVVNNLYPFEEYVTGGDVNLETAIMNIDIGGPSMIRAAAKNFKHVTVVTDPADYAAVLKELNENGDVCYETRMRLAVKAFAITARFDTIVSGFLNGQSVNEMFPKVLNLSYRLKDMFKYGENPHQKAAFYTDVNTVKGGIVGFKQLLGGELSFNNINDTNGAVELVREFSEPAVVASKHTNPCGVATGADICEAFSKVLRSDPVSIYGGIIAINREVDENIAMHMRGILLDIIIAPSYTTKALEILSKKKGTRVLELPGIADLRADGFFDIKRVVGGVIVQEADRQLFADDKSIKQVDVVTSRKPTEQEYADLLFAWKVVKHVKSNAVVIAKNGQTLGIGCGHVNRVWATKQAIGNALAILGEGALKGAALASDAYFPFDDSVTEAANAGVTAVIQPGGSIRDEDSIGACNTYDIAMICTGMRHFKH